MSFHPAILCLGEPLSALDEETRDEMYELMDSVRKQTGVTALHVTHNRREMERLADRITVGVDVTAEVGDIVLHATGGTSRAVHIVVCGQGNYVIEDG